MLNKIIKIISEINQFRKKKFPSRFVSRKKYEKLKDYYDFLVTNYFDIENISRKSFSINPIKPFKKLMNSGEICLFVSYSPILKVKHHVAKHIKALLSAGIDVVMIINTDDEAVELNQEDWFENLSGLYVRRNVGFDFGAWSDIYSLLMDKLECQRLYLINDSIIGPVNMDMFNQMLEKIRCSNADIVGLTSNNDIKWHLQSFFLVINHRLLTDQRFCKFFSSLVQLPSKNMVIDLYELRLSQMLIDLGYRAEAIFATDAFKILYKANPDQYREVMTSIGYPYTKVDKSKNTAN
jgi:lipopolysaccharide biosynthesis protein